MIARLFELRQRSLGEIDFEAVARQEGRRLLREQGLELSEQAISELIDWPLEILQRVVEHETESDT